MGGESEKSDALSVVSKSLKFPWDDRTDTNFIAPLDKNASLDSMQFNSILYFTLY